ncbi:MAG: G1 family glutamic endopeptidase [Streptosporangiaceae bacterium]
MRPLRILLAGGAAAMLGGTLALSAATAAPSAAPREHAVQAHYTAAFLAAARAAFIKDLRRPDTALFPAGRAPRRAAASLGNVTAVGSFNWAGYADTSTKTGEFTKVSGDWTVPKLTCTAEDRVTSDWVGLDGFSSSTVEQDGTASQCFKGVAVYYDWYEMYPAGTVEVANVSAGDKIAASVTRSGSSYTLKLTDSTHSGDSFSKTATCATTTCVDTSAEWIAERPAYSTTGIVPEAQFSTVGFSAGSTTAGGKTYTIGSGPAPYQITCIDSTSTYDIVSTGALSGGNAFTSTWKNSY